MHDNDDKPRLRLFREALIFQVKLMADGFRDLVLVPVSLVATLAGLIRGGQSADREFRQVLDAGRRTERWINLFGHHPDEEGRPQSLDRLLERAEQVVREQAREGGITESARKAIERTLDAAQRNASASEERSSEEPAKKPATGAKD